MPSKVYHPTTQHTRAFLKSAWAARSGLTPDERRGFAQFFYLTLCAHLEETLVAVLRKRCRYMRHLTKWEDLPEIEEEIDGVKATTSAEPIWKSILGLVGWVDSQTDSAPLARLLELYAIVFNQQIREDIGADLAADLGALAALRNMFAHGRDFFWEFEDIFAKDQFATLDSNPIQKALLRLHAAKIIPDLKITGHNRLTYEERLHSDEALLYFLGSADQIAERLLASRSFTPHDCFHRLPRLPELIP